MDNATLFQIFEEMLKSAETIYRNNESSIDDLEKALSYMQEILDTNFTKYTGEAILKTPYLLLKLGRRYKKTGNYLHAYDLYEFGINFIKKNKAKNPYICDIALFEEEITELYNKHKDEIIERKQKQFFHQLKEEAKNCFSALKSKSKSENLNQQEWEMLSLGYLLCENNIDMAIDAALQALTILFPVIDAPRKMPPIYPKKAEKSKELFAQAYELMRTGGNLKTIYKLLKKSVNIANNVAVDEYRLFFEQYITAYPLNELDYDHPLYKTHYASYIDMARQKCIYALDGIAWRLGDEYSYWEYGGENKKLTTQSYPILSEIFYTIIATIYYENFKKENNIHSLAVLLDKYVQHLDIDSFELDKMLHTPALLTYGVYWFNLAVKAWDNDQKSLAKQYAKTADEYGAKAEDVLWRWQCVEDRELRKEEKERHAASLKRQIAEWEQRDAAYNSAYRQVANQIEQKERSFNMWAIGDYSSEDEMFLKGKRDKSDFDMYNLWKDKKINDILNKK